jgi:hypothetical protein
MIGLYEFYEKGDADMSASSAAVFTFYFVFQIFKIIGIGPACNNHRKTRLEEPFRPLCQIPSFFR